MTHSRAVRLKGRNGRPRYGQGYEAAEGSRETVR